MSDNPKRLVQAGYNAVAEAYAGWSGRIVDPARERWTVFLLDELPEGARVLDLGCGNGLPSTLALAERFNVTGVDISARQIDAARRNVPGARFERAEMMEVRFPMGHFSAVTAFYSIIHLPREEQPLLIRRIAGWLRPGGYVVAAMGAADSQADIEPDWLGAPMFWSHYPAETNVSMALDAGLELVSSSEETILEDGTPANFHWLVARKPR